MTVRSFSLLSQRSGDQGTLSKTLSLSSSRPTKLTAVPTPQLATPLASSRGLKSTFASFTSYAPCYRRQASVVEHGHQTALPLAPAEVTVDRNDTAELMEKLQKVMSQLGLGKETPPVEAIDDRATSESASVSGLSKARSRNLSSALSQRSRRGSGTASGWLRKTTSCLTGGSTMSGEEERVERRPSEDILVMVQEQQRRYDDLVRQTKAEIRLTQRQNAFLKTQLEAIKKTNPGRKSLMHAVDELDASAAAARKMELKLQNLREEYETLRRKVFSNQAAQQAVESLGGRRLTIHDETWERDLEVFSKLAYAGLLKGHDEAA